MAAIELDRIRKRFADGTVAIDDLSLTVADGEFLILVGPSGCGKSTALRSVAGLEMIDGGEIRIDGAVVNDVAPADRDIAMVFQSYALYPHLTVERNIAFPLRMRKVAAAEAQRRVHDAAELLGISHLLQRKPAALSGGQRQRVAMGRAIVRQPRAFLMDEPLSNLDAKLRVQMRAELANLRRRLGVTTLYVTHDQVEAMTLGDRVAVLDGGIVQQVDAPHTLYRRPANTYVASFMGSPPMNFLPGRLRGGELTVGGQAVHGAPGWQAPDGEVLVGVRPEGLAPIASGADADGGFAFDALVELVEDVGAESVVHVRPAGLEPSELADRPIELRGTLALRVVSGARFELGERIAVRAAPDQLHAFAVDGGERISER